MVSLFPSFQYIEADGRHCLHHGTTIKSMRIVHPPSRKICFPANRSHWYFLISMRHGWNKNVAVKKSPTLLTWLHLQSSPSVPSIKLCQEVFQLPIRKFWFRQTGQHLPALGFLIRGIRQGHQSILLNKSLGSRLSPHQRKGKHRISVNNEENQSWSAEGTELT